MDTYYATDLRRFWSFVQITNTCWIWTGSGTDRYGRFSLGNKLLNAHRFSYTLFIGDIPAGMQLDHLCKRTKCVNPRHLEPVTGYVNLMRGDGEGASNARKTHCKHGHPFDAANTYLIPGGKGRACIACRTQWRHANIGKVRATARRSTAAYRARQRVAMSHG